MQPFQSNGFVWWSEREILRRDNLASEIVAAVRETMRSINLSIQLVRVEAPCLMPRSWADEKIQPHYVADEYALRAESTRGTYEIYGTMDPKPRLPVCLYQINKSFRKESSDAMRLSSYRLREFYQLEFQLFYSPDTKADYHSMFVERLDRRYGTPLELPESEWPPYSTKTTDLEIEDASGRRVEVASISTRKDFEVPVFEASFGLDRYLMLGR
jgi:hypothetical protein